MGNVNKRATPQMVKNLASGNFGAQAEPFQVKVLALANPRRYGILNTGF
jgi:hypothetical protein